MNKASQSNRQPPKFALRFLRWFCNPELLPYIEGDLLELYEEVIKQRGITRAKRWFVWEVLKLFRKELLRSPNHQLNNSIMLSHYSKFAIRSLAKNKFTSLVNVFGLATAISVVLIVFQYVKYETSFDAFHEDVSGIHRLVFEPGPESDFTSHVYTTYGLAPRLKKEIPEVEEVVRLHPPYNSVIVREVNSSRAIQEDEMYFADPSFLQVFQFPLIKGNLETALDDPNNMVISQAMAQRHFGDEDPIGRILKVNTNFMNGVYKVSGVFGPIPQNTSLRFDFLLPMESALSGDQYKDSDGWSWGNFLTIVKLDQHTDLEKLKESITKILAEGYEEEYEETKSNVSVGLQSITDIHLHSSYIAEDLLGMTTGDILSVKAFSIIAVFILVIAWVNYINLATARGVTRSKEVGIRKSMGANKRQVLNQFVVEALIINLISTLIGVLLGILALPYLNNLLGINLKFEIFKDVQFWLIFLLALLLSSLATGLYPAFMLSRFKPISMVKVGALATKSQVNSRKGLIVLQFFVAVLLIAGTFLVYHQVKYMQEQDDGMAKDQLLILKGPKADLGKNLNVRVNALKTKLKSHHSIQNVTASGEIPSSGYDWQTAGTLVGDSLSEEVSSRVIYVDEDFLTTMEMQLIAGSNFTTKSKRWKSAIINEEAAKSYGFTEPMDAIGQQIDLGSDQKVTIEGVVRNFFWHSLHHAHSPYILRLAGRQKDFLTIRVNPSEIHETIESIEEAYVSTFPNNPFDYFFLDEKFNQQFQAERQFLNLFMILSTLAIFITCIGLFAMVVFSTTQRKKEISIRKVLGAGMNGLMWLLSREYFLLLVLANVLAVPVIWLVGGEWLNEFAFRISISWLHFALPGLILLVISIATVTYRTFHTVQSNPTDSLRSE